ncbi:unnamed protein product, partial [Amoebophrya sp. A25]
ETLELRVSLPLNTFPKEVQAQLLKANPAGLAVAVREAMEKRAKKRGQETVIYSG